MLNAKYGTGLLLLGIGLMTVSGERLGFKIGVNWEFAGFATGIMLIVIASQLFLVARIDDLERKVVSLKDKVGELIDAK
jgi:ABC-type uncharacterized transport system permease subunit